MGAGRGFNGGFGFAGAVEGYSGAVRPGLFVIPEFDAFHGAIITASVDGIIRDFGGQVAVNDKLLRGATGEMDDEAIEKDGLARNLQLNGPEELVVARNGNFDMVLSGADLRAAEEIPDLSSRETGSGEGQSEKEEERRELAAWHGSMRSRTVISYS